MDRRWPARGALLALGCWGAFGVVCLLARAGGDLPGDGAVLRWLDRAADRRFDGVGVAVARATDGAVIAAVGLAVAVGLVIGRRWRAAAVFGVVLGVTLAVNPWWKEVVDLPRPSVRPLPLEVSVLSAPSGHAANTAGLVGAALLVATPRVRPLVVWGGAALVAVVGVTQLLLGVHRPSDLVAGWLWVSAWVLTVRSALPSGGDDRPLPTRRSPAP